MKKSKTGKGGSLLSGRHAVGNQIITNRGYGGGMTGQELIGAKKLSGPKMSYKSGGVGIMKGNK